MMMKALLFSALMMGPCLGQKDRRAMQEDLDSSPDEQAPADKTPPTPNPTPAGPAANIQMTISGQASDYTTSYFDTTFFPQVRTATGLDASIQIVLKAWYDGSVVVDFGLFGANAAALAAARDNIVAQANNPASALRAAIPGLQGAVSTDPVVVAVHHDDGLSDGEIAGIVIGCLTGVAIIAVIVYFLVCKEDEPHGAPSTVDAPYGGGNDGGDLQKPENEDEMAQKPAGTEDAQV
jgi:hypothetical protein